MSTSLALVHHANQYLITTGYDNREGIEAVVGLPGGGSGLTHVLGLHERVRRSSQSAHQRNLDRSYCVAPAGVSSYVSELYKSGLVELVGSSYGQNIMRFFGPDYNRRQLNEELMLYQAASWSRSG